MKTASNALKCKTLKGFSLIELMIAVTIVGIITAIALPAYTEHVQRTRRTDGQAALLSLAARMEHFYTENNTYVGATPAAVGSSTTSPEGFYTVGTSNLGTNTYTLTATPAVGGPQVGDTCGALTLNQANVKSPTTTNCW